MSQTVETKPINPGNGSSRDPLLAALGRIESKLDSLETRLAALERSNEKLGEATHALPQLAAVAVDSFDGWVENLAARGIDIDKHGRAALTALERLTSPAAIAMLRDVLDHTEELHNLLKSGVLDPSALRVVGEVGAALAEISKTAPPPAGAWDALRATRDPDVKRALGFVLALAKRFGESLGSEHLALPAAPERSE